MQVNPSPITFQQVKDKKHNFTNHMSQVFTASIPFTGGQVEMRERGRINLTGDIIPQPCPTLQIKH